MDHVMLPLSAICVVLIAHWIADFIFQSDYVGRNKGKSAIILLEHVATYTAVMAVACLPLVMMFDITTKMYMAFILLNGILHWVIDQFTSKVRAKVYNPDNTHMFFVFVGLDQLAHTIILLSTLSIIL